MKLQCKEMDIETAYSSCLLPKLCVKLHIRWTESNGLSYFYGSETILFPGENTSWTMVNMGHNQKVVYCYHISNF